MGITDKNRGLLDRVDQQLVLRLALTAGIAGLSAALQSRSGAPQASAPTRTRGPLTEQHSVRGYTRTLADGREIQVPPYVRGPATPSTT